MNKVSVLYALLCFNLITSGFAQKKSSEKANIDKESCLALVGYFSNSITIKNITIHLFMGSVLIDSAKINSTRDFGFILKRNKRYSLHITTPGYYSRLIIVNSDLSDKVKTDPPFVFEFDILLIKEMPGSDDFYLDFPIASISYDQKIKKFNFSRKYTEYMEKEVSKAEAEFKIHKPKH
jgi:hypothetical protein